MDRITHTKKNSKKNIAEIEEKRLISKYRELGAEENRIELDSALIRKVAELFAELELMKELPSVAVNPNNPAIGKETAVGKLRVKLFAAYSAAMQKLNRDLLPKGTEDDVEEGLEDFK